MPELALSVFEKLAPVDLEQRRRALIAKANGQHDNLSIDELHELAGITGVLRRRSSGPPKTKPAKAAKTNGKATVADLA